MKKPGSTCEPGFEDLFLLEAVVCAAGKSQRQQ